MADLQVSFTLGERDLKHFRRSHGARPSTSRTREKEREITAAAVELIKRAREAEPPDYVRERLDRLEQIVADELRRRVEIPEVVKRASWPRSPT